MGDGSQWGRVVKTSEGKNLWIEECVCQEKIDASIYNAQFLSAICFDEKKNLYAEYVSQKAKVKSPYLWFFVEDAEYIYLKYGEKLAKERCLLNSNNNELACFSCEELGLNSGKAIMWRKFSNLFQSFCKRGSLNALQEIFIRYEDYKRVTSFADSQKGKRSSLLWAVNGNPRGELCQYWIWAREKFYDLSKEDLIAILRSFYDLRAGIQFLIAGNCVDESNLGKIKSLLTSCAPRAAKEGKISCEELCAKISRVNCERRCPCSSPCALSSERLSTYVKAKSGKWLELYQNIIMSSPITVEGARFENLRIGKIVVFLDVDGKQRLVVLSSSDMLSNRCVEKLQDAGLFICDNPGNYRSLRRALGTVCPQKFIEVKKKTGWSTSASGNVVFLTGSRVFPETEQCVFCDGVMKIIPLELHHKITDALGLSPFAGCSSELQNFLLFLIGIIAVGPFLKFKPEANCFFHVFGLSKESLTFLAHWAGRLFASCGSAHEAWAFSDFIAKESKNCRAYQDGTIVFLPLDSDEIIKFRHFVKRIKRTRRNKIPDLYHDDSANFMKGQDSEVRVATLSFGMTSLIGTTSREKKFEYVGSETDILIQNIKAPITLDRWIQENREICLDWLSKTKNDRGFFYNKFVKEMMLSFNGFKAVLRCFELPTKRKLRIAKGALLVQRVIESPLFRCLFPSEWLGVMPNLQENWIGEEELQDVRMIGPLFSEIKKLQKQYETAFNEVNHQLDFSFMFYKERYCYFDRGHIFSKFSKKTESFREMCCSLYKASVLIPAQGTRLDKRSSSECRLKGRSSISLYIPKTEVRFFDYNTQKYITKFIGGKSCQGYLLDMKNVDCFFPFAG